MMTGEPSGTAGSPILKIVLEKGLSNKQVKERLEKGEPLIVMSKPYLVGHRGWFDDEYFINVKFKNSDEIYSIMNSKTNVFKSYYDYISFISDCEECAAFGY